MTTLVIAKTWPLRARQRVRTYSLNCVAGRMQTVPWSYRLNVSLVEIVRPINSKSLIVVLIPTLMSRFEKRGQHAIGRP
jgi:hypothetical protein